MLACLPCSYGQDYGIYKHLATATGHAVQDAKGNRRTSIPVEGAVASLVCHHEAETVLVWPPPCGAKLFAFTATGTVNPEAEFPGRCTVNTGRGCTRPQHSMHLACDM
jgi:hypothetical protein